MSGESCSWYEMRQNMSRLPEFVNPETTGDLNEKERGKLNEWAESRLTARLE
jgi:hypothetical protein